MTTRALVRFILPILVLLIAGAIYQTLVASKPERKKPELREKVWQIDVLEARQQALSPSITLYGRIESPEQLQAAAPGGGVIEKVFVRNGARVSRDQQLVSMDRRDFEASLLQAQADLRDLDNQIEELKIRHQANLASLKTERNLLSLAEAEVERLAKLKKQNLSADTALNGARAELGRQQLSVTSRELDVDSYPAKLQILVARHDRARAQLAQSQLAMTRSDIRAPFDALISEVMVSAGDRVSLGETLISLFPLASLEIRAHLPVNYIAPLQRAIAQDQRLEASVNGRSELGRFPVVRLAGDAEATGIDIYFEVGAESPGLLRPGELLALNLELPPIDDVFAVPYQSIYGNSRIYRVSEDRLQALNVESVGQARDEAGQIQVLIRSPDLLPGNLIATTHLPNAVSGLKVKINETR